MANLAPLMTSKRDDWETPQAFFDCCNMIYHYDLDVCANETNAKCERYYTPEIDAFTQVWGPGSVWCNPPYGNGVIERWIERAHRAARTGECKLISCLVPARTETDWFRWCVDGRLDFIVGRLKFVGGSSGATFPSVLVTFFAGLPQRERNVGWWDWRKKWEKANAKISG